MKRTIDVLLSAVGIVCLFPILIVVAALIATKLGRPIFFRQIRPGEKGVLFNMVKFRTMTDERDENGDLLSDSKRLTRFGRFLRSSSIDELPELWNVLKGDMSLVGPRPLLVEYLDLYTRDQARRHEVRPGVTGWAQVNGRNTVSWNEKFKYDVWYVDNRSIWLDIKILWLTVKKVLIREGINAAGDATMPRFTGKAE